MGPTVTSVQNTGYKTFQRLGQSPRFGLTPAKLTWQKLESTHDPYFGEIEHYKFSNGMEFYGLQRKDIPLVSYGDLVKTGAMNENDRTDGVSHFLEHLLFKGTTNLKPGDSDRILSNLGASINAYTSYDQTFYYTYNMPKEALPKAIAVHAERIQNALIPSNELLKERFVVVEEISMRHNKKPYLVGKKLRANLWPDNNASRNILGPSENIGDFMRIVLDGEAKPEDTVSWRKILESLQKSDQANLSDAEKEKAKQLKEILDKRGLTPQAVLELHPFNTAAKPLSENEFRTKVKVNDLSREEILGYYAKYYAPENRTVIAVGDYNTNDVLNQIAENYNQSFPQKGREPAGEERHYIQPAPPRHPGLNVQATKDDTLTSDIKIALVAQGYKGPGTQDVSTQKQRLALELLAGILGSGESSRLYQQLVEKEKIANDVGCGYETYKSTSKFGITAQTNPKDLPIVKVRFREAIDKIIKEGVTPEELAKIKILSKQGLASASENQSAMMYVLADIISSSNLKYELGSSLKLLDTITSQDIQEVAKLYLTEDKSHTVSMVPKTSTDLKPATPQFAGNIRFGGALGPRDQATKLSNGSELIVQERPKALNTSFTITLKGGENFDNIPGLYGLMAQTLVRGTDKMSASELQKRLDEKAIGLIITPSSDRVTISIHGLSESKKDMFGILKELLAAPAFKQEEWEFVKKQFIDDYQAKVDTSPVGILSDLLIETLIPENHPQGQTDKRTIAALDRMSPEKFKDIYGKLFNPGRMTIAAVGDIKLDEAKQYFSDLLPVQPNAPLEVPGISEIKIDKNKVVTIAKDDVTQADIFKVWIAPKAFEKGFHAMVVLNTILSGSMASRLMQTFRENEKGLCYNVYSSYTPSFYNGSFKFYIGTNPTNIRKVLDMFQSEITKLMETKPTEEELARTKAIIKSGVLASTQSSLGMSEKISAHRLFQSPSSEESLKELEKVTAEDVQAVAKEYFTRPSVTAVLAPKSALENSQLPVNGEALI